MDLITKIRTQRTALYGTISRYSLRSWVYNALADVVSSSSTAALVSKTFISWRDAFLQRYYSMYYDAPIDPRQLINVNPNAISKKRTSVAKEKIRRGGLVQDGDWDADTRALADYPLYYSIREHFEEGVPWSETDHWERVKKQCESNTDWNKWGCDDFGEFEERLRRLDDLYELMDEEGYMRQSEILHSPKDPMGYYEESLYPLPPEYHEITVFIGRDGELLFHDGRHRLAIASALGIDSVPVRVKVRHQEWQDLRDEVYRGETVSIDHPDIDNW